MAIVFKRYLLSSFFSYSSSPGKSLSDMLGSQAKRALERGVARVAEFTGRDSEAVARVIRKNLQEETKKFKSIEVTVVPPFERPDKEAGVKVPAITKVRHVTMTGGRIVARETACFSCIESAEPLCPACTVLPSYPKVAATGGPETGGPEASGEEEGEVGWRSSGDRLEDPFGLITDADRADAEDEDEEMVAATKDEEAPEHGDIFWVKERRGSFWPGQSVPLSLVPTASIKKFGCINSESMCWVLLFGREEFKPVPRWSLFPFLGTAPFDLDAMGIEPARIAAFNLANFALHGC